MSIPRKIRLVSVFTAVAEHGGFRAAARHLGLSAAQVSQGVADLEAELGTALIYRSTKRVQLTQKAEAALPHFRAMMNDFERGLDVMNIAQPAELRISVPTVLAQRGFAEILAQWRSQNPDTSLVIDVNDNHHARAERNADLLIRFGGPSDDMRIAKLLGVAGGFLGMRKGAWPIASKKSDLQVLPLALPQGLHAGLPLFHKQSGERVLIGTHPEIVTNNTQMLTSLMRTGYIVAPVFAFQDIATSDEIEDVAPEWSAEPLEIRAIYASENARHSPAQSFVSFLSQNIGKIISPVLRPRF